MIEALVYRFFHQNGPFPGSAFGYRTKEEEAAWRARDPLERVAAEMTKLGLINEAGVAAVRAQAVDAMKAAAAALTEQDPDAGPHGPRTGGSRPRLPLGRAYDASGRRCGRTRRSLTWASAATCPRSRARAPWSSRTFAVN